MKYISPGNKYRSTGSSLGNLFNERITGLILSGKVKVWQSLKEFKERKK